MTHGGEGCIVWVTAHGRSLVESRGWSTRPAMLARSVAALGIPVIVVARTKPLRILRAWQRLRWRPRLGLVFESNEQLVSGLTHLEHPAPVGPLERWQLRRIVDAAGTNVRAVVVSDPRSAAVLSAPVPGVKVFDAYDAWDLSPLYRDQPRLVKAILEGYRAAARHADVVVVNTAYMKDRMLRLGARHVEVVPNGGPAPARTPPRGTGVLYLGNIQSRIRMDLLTETARVAARDGSGLHIVGAIQDEPEGWSDLLAQPGVVYSGAVHGDQLQTAVEGASVGVIPHRVDEYTVSQDAMKAWEYLARGMSIVSTPVPPAVGVPDMATIANDPTTFAEAVTDAIVTGGRMAQNRLRLAGEHTWTQRAERLLELIG